MSRWHRRVGDERGTVLVFVALTMTVLIGSTALAVDIGQLTARNRGLQAVADAVAIDAARAINGSNAGLLMAASGAVTAAVQNGAVRNNFPYAQLQTELGTKTGSNPFVPAPSGSTIPNAARITASDHVSFGFAPGGRDTSRPAVAVKDDRAGFSIGSFLVGVNPPDNSILDQVFGDSFGAHVLAYDGLFNANLTLRAIGLNMPVTALSPTQLLNTSVSVKDLMLASAAALNDGSHTATVNVLNAMAASITSTTMVKLGDAIKVAAGSEQAAADAQINLLQMLTATALVVDGTHAINVPAANVNVPGVGNVAVTLEVITPAQTAWGPVGTSAENEQLHLTLTPQIHLTTSATVNACSLQSTLSSVLSLNAGELLTCLTGGFVARVISLDLNASIPIDLSVAGAKATLTNINCGASPSITLHPELQPLTLNSNVDLTFTATLLGNSLGNVLRVRGSAGAHVQSTPPDQTFLYPSEFGPAHTKTVGSNTLSAAGMTTLTATDTTLLNANLGPVLSAVSTAALSVVNSTMVQIDTNLTSRLRKLLGLNIGGADLTALGDIECGKLRLAE